MITEGYILGIDPDSVKSGFALLDCKERTFEFMDALTFPEAIRYFDSLAASEVYRPLRVIIENSDVSTAFNQIDHMHKKAVFAYGRSVGKCHGTYEHLMECAEACGLKPEPIKPLVKSWSGHDRKITHEELAYFTNGIPKRTNSEMRDAALIAWCIAEFPVRRNVRRNG